MIFILTLSCNQHKNEFYIKQFPLNLEFRLDELAADTILPIKQADIEIMGHHLLIYDSHAKNYVFQLYDMYPLKYLTSFGKIGLGPQEITKQGFYCIDNINKTVWIADAGKHNLLRYRIDDVLRGNFHPTERVPYPINDDMGVLNFKVGSDNNFINQTFYQNYLFQRFDLEGNHIEYFGKNFKTDDIHIPIEKFYFMFTIHSDFSKYALSYTNFDELRILDKNGKVLKSIVGPNQNKNNDPDYSSYRRIKSTENYIYCHYNGGSRITHTNTGFYPNFGNKLFIFDWSGNPKAQLIINEPFINFTVDQKSNRIIFYTPDNHPFKEISFFEEQLSTLK